MPVVGHGADLDGAPLACTLREREGRHCQRTRFVILDTGLLWSRAVITFRFLLLTYLCHSLLLVVMGVKCGLWRAFTLRAHAQSSAQPRSGAEARTQTMLAPSCRSPSDTPAVVRRVSFAQPLLQVQEIDVHAQSLTPATVLAFALRFLCMLLRRPDSAFPF